MRIALIAHDNKKEEMLQFVKTHQEQFKKHILSATNSTGKMIKENTLLDVYCHLSGPLGGDQQIGSEIATGNVDLVIFLRDPLTAQPHEPDITALLRICDVHNIPVSTNLATAEVLIHSTS
ncbi:methylglyoxal synthase [Natranaerobius trueperi]|uniref:Methylglyoxal synthase n=1 Tax=Natranaerobius trueperi TaxID=759412 RepID=A0A226BX86_9FIRM|nr:methylglyoxal synthase [Natranaerobius trueperi]OWZ83531.1 methylglyoxal synthase [Natranaerobius trueperi]